MPQAQPEKSLFHYIYYFKPINNYFGQDIEVDLT